MTEERRAEPAIAPLADATAKAAAIPLDAAPKAIDSAANLDDLEVEEVPAARIPPVEPRARTETRPGIDAMPASQPPPSQRGRDSSPGAKRGRARMAIRIPDDEISRPQPAVVSSPEPTPTIPQVTPSPPESPPSAPLQPMRIISIEATPSQKRAESALRSQAQPVAAPSGPRPSEHEDSWTPYQPTASDARADGAESAGDEVRAAARSEDLIPIESEPVLDSPESGEPLELDEAEARSLLSSKPPPAKAAAPAVSVPPAPKLPAVERAAPRAAPLPPIRSQVPTEPEGEEIRFDDDEPPPKAPAKTAAGDSGDRVSEPGDAAEIAPEDLVSVESVPSTKQKQDFDMGQPTPVRAFVPPALSVPTPAKAFIPPGSVTPPPATTALPPMRAKSASIPSHPPPAAKPAPAVAPPPAGGRAPLVIVPPHAGVAPPQSDSASSRRKARPWWEELFNDDFIRTMAKITNEQIALESDFIEDSLGVAKGGTMLDLACGTGRHAIELARRGYEVVGFDLSLAMLARAADEAQERDQKLNFVQGDMREMSFDEAFDGIYCWNTSFGFFDEESNNKVIGKVHKSLKKGGQFVLDVVNRDFTAHQAPSLCWFEGDGCVCMDEMQVDWITSRMRVKRTMMMDDGRSKEIEYTIRIYSLHELGKILHDQGFRVAEVSGRPGTPGVFFGGESPRTLILAEKR